MATLPSTRFQGGVVLSDGVDANAENQETIARLTGCLRTLEERRHAGLATPANVTFFLAALDRKLTDEERGYTAMAFGACKEVRDELTAMLEKRLGVGRGFVIAGIRAHLAGTFTRSLSGDTPLAVTAYLDYLRAQVLVKAGRLG